MSEIRVARIVQPEETASIFWMISKVALQSLALPARPTDDDIARIDHIRAPEKIEGVERDRIAFSRLERADAQ